MRHLVCRQLGYAYALKALRGNDVPNGSAKMWLGYVSCIGHEKNISSCFHSGFGNTRSRCQHGEVAGVECSSTGKLIMVN